MNHKMLIGAVMVWAVAAGSVHADDLAEVDAMMKEKVDGVISVLRDKASAEEVRRKKIIGIVNSVFDFDLMARLSLGKKHWLELSPADQKKYTDLFVKRIQDSYLDKMNLYSDEEVVYEPAAWVKKRVNLQTHLVSNENRVSVLYKLYKAQEGWKIYDLEIQGVSFVQTYRKQFEGILNNGTIADLFHKLEAPEEFPMETPGGKASG